IVISDSLYESDKIIQICPTISIGGPGVNALAARLAEILPIQISKDDRFFIQYNEKGGDNIVSIWGMDQESTKAAVELYIQDGYLDKFIKKVWS
ncbi:MAG: hypothetical protein GX409_09895, partial [candidate division Zixibacteria bacterium]|nr:hypothetical protein [candidate division Zixibacteria bacterium]